MSEINAQRTLDNLARLVTEGTATRSLQDRREELKIIRAQSVERARQQEAEDRRNNPRLDTALTNLEKFGADFALSRSDRDLARDRDNSPGGTQRLKRVSFAATPRAS